MTQGNLFIIAAPSGAGKTSLVRRLLEIDPQVSLSISYTTRPPRPNETDGRDYHFIDQATFDAMRDRGDFLECAEVYGNCYGTSQPWIESALQSGQDIVLEIDWQGAQQVRRLMPEAIGIFILPPSQEILAMRLAGRGQDPEEVIARRLAAAQEDMRHAVEFEYIIVNDDFETALRELHAVFVASRLTRERQFAAHADRLNQLLK